MHSNDGTPWIPNAQSVICSDHFIGNKPSKHPNNPAYIPTIFPETYKKLKSNCIQQSNRYKRFCNRNIAQSTVTQLNPNEREAIDNTIDYLAKCDVGVQVSLDATNIKEFSFESSFINNNCCSTSITTPNDFIINQRKNSKNVSCGPNSESFNSCLNCDKFHGYESIINNENSIKDLTGCSNAVFDLLFKMLPDANINSSLKNHNQLLLFLMKIKLGITFSALGVLFNIHRTTVSRIFFNLLSILCHKTKNFIFWPIKDTILETLP